MNTYVRTDCVDGASYLSANKEYKVYEASDDGGFIEDDLGRSAFVYFDRSSHIGDSKWEVVRK